MSKALFFNALPDATSSTGYDRNYNADDLSDFMSIVCDTGVVKTNTVDAEAQGLKVVAASGMAVNVNAGKAVIKGKAFINDALANFTVAANGTAANRYDLVVVKFDNNISARNITIEVRTGTSYIPTVASLTRNDKIYELMLAYITVAPSATSITQTNIQDTRGDTELCPWFTAVKGYDEYYDAIIQRHEDTKTMPSISNTVITNLPSKLYNERYSLIEVYTNGIKEPEGAFTASVSGGYVVITFTAQKAAETKITVILNNFIDGEGMTTALAQYTQLVQDVADLKANGDFNYVCNGVNDNILISNLYNSIIASKDSVGGKYKINIIGNIGFTSPAQGTGIAANPYKWFGFNYSNATVILDFANCAALNIPIANGTSNVIFGGENVTVKNAYVIADNIAADTAIVVFSGVSGFNNAENCSFRIYAYKDSCIAYHGTFTNCDGVVANSINNSYCFTPNTNGLIRLEGGEYRAYTKDNNVACAILGQGATDAVSILRGVNASAETRIGYYQKNAILQLSGGGVVNCTDLITTLPVSVISGISNVVGTINKNKLGKF